MLIAGPAVRHDDPRIGADQCGQLLAVAVLGDLEARRAGAGHGPQRTALTGRPPAGLIDVHRVLLEDPVLQLGVRAGERVAGALADRVDRAGREPGPEQIRRELAGSAARDPVPRRQRHDRRLQAHAERRPAHLGRQLGDRLGPALRAAQPMRAMLDHDHADRRQLSDLMTTAPATAPALILAELTAAATTRVRIVIDDLIDLVLGREPATRAAMPLLPARLALGTIPGQQLLRLRARLRTPLLTRLRRILRRRLRARARVLTGLRFQPPQPLLKPLHPRSEIEHELHADLPAGVIDRLSLGTIHSPKIRRPPPRTLLWRPTTERLPGKRCETKMPEEGLEPPTRGS
jgi:hypothetical protein